MPYDSNDMVSALLRVSDEIAEDPETHEKKTRLIFLINQLIVHDFNALVQLLYRIDVDERKLKKVLSNNIERDAASVIADLIIERQIQKTKSRKTFHRDNTSEEEPW